MGLFGNRKDDLEKESKKVSEKYEEEDEEDEEDSEATNSVRILLVNNEDGIYNIGELTKEEAGRLKEECKDAILHNTLVDLEKYGKQSVLNGKYIVSFDWETEDD